MQSYNPMATSGPALSSVALPCHKRETLLKVYISALYSHNTDVLDHTALLGTDTDPRLVEAAESRVAESRLEYIAAREAYVTHLREHRCDQLPTEPTV